MLSNIRDLIHARIHGGSTSLILFFGGIAGLLAMFACPLAGAARWAWVPPLLDPGCIPAGVLILHAVATGKFSESAPASESDPQPDSGPEERRGPTSGSKRLQ